MGAYWTRQWRNLEFRIERRASGRSGGPTLRISDTLRAAGALSAAGASSAASAASVTGPTSSVGEDARGLERLRFDCFARDPHWHVDPAGRDEIHPLPHFGDPIAETFSILEQSLPHWLAQAGAPADVVSDVEKVFADSNHAKERASLLRDAECAMRHRPVDLDMSNGPNGSEGPNGLDDLDLRVLEQRRSSKWQYHPRDILPAWVAEMDYPLAEPILAELRRLTEIGDAGYPLGDQETGLPDAFCERMNDRFGWHPDPRRVELLSEVVQGLYIALDAYTEKGEGAIVQTPIYPPFLQVVSDLERRLVDNPMVPRGDRLEFDLDGLAGLIDASTKVLMLCNPHNPSGRVMERPELERLGTLALEHDLIVVTDEIHADLLYDGREHIPFATLSAEIANRTVTLTSASKAFNIPGLRSAVAHFGSDALQQRFNRHHPRHFRGGVGLFGIYASIAAWRWGQPWLDEVVCHLEGNRDYVGEALAERIPEIRLRSPEATYLAWLDCSALEFPGSPATHFYRQGRLALSPGQRYGPDWHDHVRLNFATSRPILTEIIDRMAKSLGR